jgi:hypothetical protein
MRRINEMLVALPPASGRMHPSHRMRALCVVAFGALLSACGGRVRAGATADAGAPDAAAYDGGGEGAGDGGGVEAGSTVVVLASGDLACANDIVVDATSLYWTSGDSVMKVPLDGGATTTLASDQPNPQGIAVDATALYWVNGGDGSADGTVMKVPLDGGSPVVLASGQSKGTVSIALDATHVYWGTGGGIMVMGLAGGTPQLIVSAGSPTIFAVDATSVYWAGQDLSGVWKSPLDGGAAVILAPGTGIAGTLLGTSVYVLLGQDVVRVPVDGGAPVTIASSKAPARIAVDSTGVYWTDWLFVYVDGGPDSDGRVMSVPSAGGTPTTLADALAGPGAIAVDATSVYWAEQSDPCTIKKLSPK